MALTNSVLDLLLDPLFDLLLNLLLDPVFLLRAFYLAAAAFILFIQCIPALRSRFLAYGSRATSPSLSHTSPSSSETSPKTSTNRFTQFVDHLTTFQVPHSYFTHFYALSVACSLFWGYRIWGLPQRSERWKASNDNVPSQLQIAWLMMALQGVRRLMESDLYTPKNSGSQMWIGHYALGLLFYFTINMAIWIEAGVPVLNRAVPFIDWTKHMTPDPMVQKFPSNGETLKVVILPPAILTFHFLQHSYHSYLHSLRTEHSTYQLPSHPYFPHLLCPHYSCEVMIYLLLSLLAAPAGGWVNWTLFTATVFVAVNLGVTANGTRAWYIKNFGKERVGGRKRMVPGVW